MQKIYYGGRIMTMLGENDYVDAILVNDGKIIATGVREVVLDKVSEDTEYEEIDLNGQTLMPAFIDPHSHVSMVAQTAFMANLADCKNFEDIQEALIKYKEEKNLSDTAPIIGFGYDHNFLTEESHPTRKLLDKVSETNPIFILHTSAHMGSVNSATLSLAGITGNTEDPHGGVIGREKDGKEPNGYLEESAMGLVQGLIFSNLEMDFNE